VLPGGRTLDGEVLDVVRDELNVKEVEFLGAAEELVRFVGKPNYRSLGQRFGSDTQKAADAVRKLTQDQLSTFRDGGDVSIEVDGATHALEREDVEILQEATGELVVRTEGRFTVALDPTLDDELRAEGMARELVNRIQRLRRDAGLEITDRIELVISGPAEVVEPARIHRDFIAGEVLATALTLGEDGDAAALDERREVDLDGTSASIGLRRAGG
jgi:isoleucyl-tRNA synthetase